MDNKNIYNFKSVMTKFIGWAERAIINSVDIDNPVVSFLAFSLLVPLVYLIMPIVVGVLYTLHIIDSSIAWLTNKLLDFGDWCEGRYPALLIVPIILLCFYIVTYGWPAILYEYIKDRREKKRERESRNTIDNDPIEFLYTVRMRTPNGVRTVYMPLHEYNQWMSGLGGSNVFYTYRDCGMFKSKIKKHKF